MALAPTPKRARKSKSAKPRAAGSKPLAGPAKPRRPAPATFTDGHFSSPQGSLDYRLYTPAGSARRRLPLVVMLHGCTQTVSEFASGTRMNEVADELGFLVLYPQQSSSANLARCWNWHRPGDQKRGGGEPAAIAALTRHVTELCRANPDRVYIAGISAGGAAAAIIGAAYPDLFVAVGVHSGLVRGDVTTVGGALSAMRSGHRVGDSRPVCPPPCPPSCFTEIRTLWCTPRMRRAS